jgi:hypothetical protein
MVIKTKCIEENCANMAYGERCKVCHRTKGKNDDEFALSQILSSQTINMNESGLANNAEGTLFSNPSFKGGSLVDIEYVATTVDMKDATITEGNDIPAEKFTLVQLITSIVAKQTAPLQKRIADLEKDNATLKEEVKAAKAENEVSNGITVDIETKLAPFSEAVKKIAPLEQTIQNHQRYLDQVDAKKRETNVIITGVNETPGCDDDRTVKSILQAVGCETVQPVKILRIGKKNDDLERKRPILLVTESNEERTEILKSKNKLKDGDAGFKSVYMKADEPLCVQKEWKRLKAAMKREKDAPSNVGCTIKIDYKKRELLRDAQVIDRFRSPFRKGGPNQ